MKFTTETGVISFVIKTCKCSIYHYNGPVSLYSSLKWGYVGGKSESDALIC